MAHSHFDYILTSQSTWLVTVQKLFWALLILSVTCHNCWTWIDKQTHWELLHTLISMLFFCNWCSAVDSSFFSSSTASSSLFFDSLCSCGCDERSMLRDFIVKWLVLMPMHLIHVCIFGAFRAAYTFLQSATKLLTHWHFQPPNTSFSSLFT